MLLNVTFCSYWGVIQWLQDHLLTCPFKKLTGFDCPGCGFQRSILALLQGDLLKSILLYPATIPIFIIALTGIFESRLPAAKLAKIKKPLYVVTGVIIAGSYALKLSVYMHLIARF
jgi:hypothetical protein